jgi:hypothetical protein
MDEEKRTEQVKQGLEDEIKAYKKLQKVGELAEFNDFFEFQLKTAADKMIWAFTTGKEGDNIKNWDDFCKVRGEIIARLHPIQEIRGAESMVAYMKQQLDNYYNKQPV